ncbi:MAG: host attachment protein [Acidithiobacillus ferrooxidans]|uniref:host attachment protein n=1 Tax=Acidithiobacillus ferrooxidans TaxID=920 RepID=UPI001C06FDC2|nr:host attachment protein [Acidithiobacillus ferrooxidans]MBU2807361.1 host attachment protein [Acidithiobacillus ferrooxidans F221]MDD2748245.1 host attachment protein [Acidithiobacillus ferrooxidans]
MATVTWVLVSNAAEARLFKNEGCNTGLHLVQDWQHPDSRKHQDELVTDAGGRVQQSFAAGARPGIEWQTSPKEAEMLQFANELATYLGAARKQNAFQHLVLVASPHVLGLLREKLDAPTSAMISGTLSKDYTYVGIEELSKHLAEVMCP